MAFKYKTALKRKIFEHRQSCLISHRSAVSEAHIGLKLYFSALFCETSLLCLRYDSVDHPVDSDTVLLSLLNCKILGQKYRQ